MPSFGSLIAPVPVALVMAFTPGPATFLVLAWRTVTRWGSGLALVGLGLRLALSRAR